MCMCVYKHMMEGRTKFICQSSLTIVENKLALPSQRICTYIRMYMTDERTNNICQSSLTIIEINVLPSQRIHMYVHDGGENKYYLSKFINNNIR